MAPSLLASTKRQPKTASQHILAPKTASQHMLAPKPSATVSRKFALPLFVSCKAPCSEDRGVRKYTHTFVFKFMGGELQYRKYREAKTAVSLEAMIDDVQCVEAEFNDWKRLGALHDFQEHQEKPAHALIVCVVDTNADWRGLYHAYC